MVLDKEIETPMGIVRFKGEVSDEEFDYIVKTGLIVLMARGQIQTSFVSGTDGEETEDFIDMSGPEDGEQLH